MHLPDNFVEYDSTLHVLEKGQNVWHLKKGYCGMFIQHADCNELYCLFDIDDGVEAVPEKGLFIPMILL
jgi:hypothetical protein